MAGARGSWSHFVCGQEAKKHDCGTTHIQGRYSHPGHNMLKMASYAYTELCSCGDSNTSLLDDEDELYHIATVN